MEDSEGNDGHESVPIQDQSSLFVVSLNEDGAIIDNQNMIGGSQSPIVSKPQNSDDEQIGDQEADFFNNKSFDDEE